MKAAPDYQTNSPRQYHKKCIENSVENMKDNFRGEGGKGEKGEG